MTETFAQYLAKNYMVHKGYKLGTVPEAHSLVDASDIVMTRGNGLNFEIICIVDTEKNPGKNFGLSVEEVRSIGQSCAKYTVFIQKRKVPPAISIFEVGPHTGSPSEIDLLSVFKSPKSSAVSLSASLVDTTDKVVRSNQQWGGFFSGSLFVKKLLRAPRTNDDVLKQVIAVKAHYKFTKTPPLTCFVLGILLFVFMLEQFFPVGTPQGFLTPNILTLLAIGGLQKQLVVHYHQFFRLISAAFLHSGIIHLFLNCICLYLAGIALENLVGRWWFCALFFGSALSGSLMSMALNSPHQISVGASGAIMGLLTAAYIFSHRIPYGAGRTRLQMQLIQILIPSLIPLAVSLDGHKIDYASHVGGAIGGLLMGGLVLALWPLTSQKPKAILVPILFTLAGLAMGVDAIYRAIHDFSRYAVMPHAI